jgi:arylsulfatase A-like enzyme
MQEQVRGVGFDFAEAIAWGNTDNRPLRRLQYHNLEWHTAAALEFLETYARGDRPFFLTMATTTMHGPHHVESLKTNGLQTEVGYLDNAPQVQPARSTIFQRLRDAGLPTDHHTAGALWMDDAFGAVMRRIEYLGLADNTIVIWSTDHGIGTIGGKFTCYQGGVQIPFCMKWPGQIEAGLNCDALIQNVDFLPTVLDMVGVPLPEGLSVDGVSRWPQLAGKEPDAREDLYFEWGYTRAVRTRKWKYVAFRHTPEQIETMVSGKMDMAFNMRGQPGGEFGMHLYPSYWDPDQLYDLDEDPEEQRNLAGDPRYLPVLREMQTRLRKYLARFDCPFDLAVHPFVASPEYRRLAENAMADESIYEADWYVKGAF